MGTTHHLAAAATGLLLLGALAGCGDDEPRRAALAGGTATPTATATPSAAAAPSATATPAAAPVSTATAQPGGPTASRPATPAPRPSGGAPGTGGGAAGAGGYDLDGDGRGDAVELRPVPGTGWSFDVRLADGRETSAPLPLDLAVEADAAVVGPVDLDADGRHEVLVRTLRAVGGDNAVVFRLDGDGVWLVRTPDGAPWELATSGGMSGPRSYACLDAAPRAGREVQTRESDREGTADAAPAYRTTTRTWGLSGHVVELLSTQEATGVPAEQVNLDPSTC